MSQEVSVGTGGAVFAGILLIIGGALWMLQGLAGIVKGTSYLENADYWITTSAGTWGWIPWSAASSGSRPDSAFLRAG